jgi:multidrug efflux pump subunit AcrA (membrane-fusion protein)
MTSPEPPESPVERAPVSSAVGALRRLWTRLGPSRGVLALAVGVGAVALWVVLELVLPGYRRPANRTYPSPFGYPALLRKMGRPLPVETAVAEKRPIAQAYLGEGIMASEPVLVPMLALGRIVAVHAEAGQPVKKGDLLVELDASQGRLRVEQAKLAYQNAQAELGRVRLGSVNQLGREQPGRDEIDLRSLRDQVGILREQTAMYAQLEEQGVVSKEQVLLRRKSLVEAERALANAELSLKSAAPGKGFSERIGANELERARLVWIQSQQELEESQVLAPADGLVERVLVHAGEYNQSVGRPAFAIASGLWFEAHLDQLAVGRVAVGARAEVHLAAKPGVTYPGRVTRVNPIVSYGTGGPEGSRPVRPVGTSAPEWPATFAVQIDLDRGQAEADGGVLAPGLTGFARVVMERSAVAVPEGAVLSMEAGRGMVHVLAGGKREIRVVRTGATDRGWVEILEGVSADEKVIVEGQQVLQEGDLVEEFPWKPRPESGR